MTTKVRAVFDASAKTSTGTSLNDILLVGPTVHPPLVDVFMPFRSHRVALITDVSRMYQAVLHSESDKDLHRFVWRKDPTSPLKDSRMTLRCVIIFIYCQHVHQAERTRFCSRVS